MRPDRTAVRTAPCPTCRAVRGAPCWGEATRQPRARNHEARITAYMALHAAAGPPPAPPPRPIDLAPYRPPQPIPPDRIAAASAGLAAARAALRIGAAT